MKHSTLNKIKFMRLKRRLNLPAWGVTGILEMLWAFAAVNAQDGGIGRFKNEDIAAWIEWEGDADQLISQLIEEGWIDHHETARLVIHDWHQHCPNYIKGAVSKKGEQILTTKAPEAKVEAKLQAKDKAKHQAKEEAKLQANPGSAPSPSSKPSSLVYSSQTNLRHPSPNGEGSSAPVATNALAATEPDILTFPCAKGKRTADESWGLKSKQISDWQSAFPGVQVLAECKKALAWVLANPAHKKTASGMPEFLYRWLAKANDRRPSGSIFPGPASVRDQRRAEDTAATARVLSGGPISPAVDGLLADYQAVQELKKARADPNPDLGGDRAAETKPGPFPGISEGGRIFE